MLLWLRSDAARMSRSLSGRRVHGGVLSVFFDCRIAFVPHGMSQPVLAQGASHNVYRSPEQSVGNVRAGDRRIAVLSPTAIGAKDAFSVSYVSIDPTKSRISLVAARDPQSGGTSLARFAFDEQASAVLNGGFLESRTPTTPAGLVQIGRKTVNQYVKDNVMDGVLCFLP